jgi:hypothetical protein
VSTSSCRRSCEKRIGKGNGWYINRAEGHQPVCTRSEGPFCSKAAERLAACLEGCRWGGRCGPTLYSSGCSSSALLRLSV